MSDTTIEVKCPFCQSVFKRNREREEKHPIQFCAYCGARLQPSSAQALVGQHAILLKEHKPDPEDVMGSIGQFLLLKSIGKGGMGEVFLAFDTVCGRRVALKRIRPDLVTSPQLKERFVREARITSQLIHPSIIPIYSIFIEKDLIYYTMPYIAGQTLKQILRQARENEADHRGSIPSLVRLYLNVLHAVAYAHSKGVLHRDLKPENVIIGTYGEVIILDWGLTKLIEETEDENEEDTPSHHRLTRAGKPVGTVAYMAPERAQGSPASRQTDIYALGGILYQILTLKLPFSRKNMQNFLKICSKEEFIAPEVRAPYRDVPQPLSEVVRKCLAPNPEDRYTSCDELIDHIESFLEGRSEWFPVKKLSVETKQDWEFQENILLSEHTAITRSSELAEWYGLMLTDGYCLWLTTKREKRRRTTLLRSGVAVFEAPDLYLEPNISYDLCIEKIDQTITFTINGTQQFSYLSHFPVVGTHVGLLTQDNDFEIGPLELSIGSQSIMVRCLAVPDAFFANGDYDKALTEYRRIGNSFFGRAEGREAFFRAGVTLLEKGKEPLDLTERESIFDLARHEFEKLRQTPGAPLEYLGKALIYQTTGEFQEEIKCFELAFRRYKDHPLLRVIIEQVVLRMHETSQRHRVAAYYFISLAIRFLSNIATKPSSKKLFDSLHKHWEVPPFLLSRGDEGEEQLRLHRFCLGISFWLEQPFIVREILDTLIETPVLPIAHIIDCLVLFAFFNQTKLLEGGLKKWKALLCSDEQEKYSHLFSCLELLLIEDQKELYVEAQKRLLETSPHDLEAHILLLLMEKFFRKEQYAFCLALYEIKGSSRWSKQLHDEMLARAIESALLLDQIETAKRLLKTVDKRCWTNEESSLFFSYGCFLAATKGKNAAIEHFEQVLDAPYPRSWIIGAHVISGKLQLNAHGWLARSFAYERAMLKRQLKLFEHIIKTQVAPYISTEQIYTQQLET
jgi:serine/threonine-protein kinase